MLSLLAASPSICCSTRRPWPRLRRFGPELNRPRRCCRRPSRTRSPSTSILTTREPAAARRRPRRRPLETCKVHFNLITTNTAATLTFNVCRTRFDQGQSYALSCNANYNFRAIGREDTQRPTRVRPLTGYPVEQMSGRATNRLKPGRSTGGSGHYYGFAIPAGNFLFWAVPSAAANFSVDGGVPNSR